MPVILESITQPSPQDVSDLVKIYQHYAPQPLAEDLSIWLDEQLKSGLFLFAGRFNSRLVGAVWVNQQPDGWHLEWLCVRDITRGRGVARQLLTLLAKYAGRQQQTLIVAQQAAPESLQLLLSELGFSQYNGPTNHWQLNPTQTAKPS